jgi:hypothetical protein
MKVEEIAEAIAKLPPDQLARFRRWFAAFEAGRTGHAESSIPLRLNLVGSPAARWPTASRVMGGSGWPPSAGAGNDVSDHVTAPCQRCTIHPSGRCQAPGTSWIYSRIGPDRIQVKPGGRSSFLLGDAHDKSVGLSTDAATNSRDARGWRLWRFAAWRGRVAPNSAPPTPITAVWCPL